jgi:hypothetical protein
MSESHHLLDERLESVKRTMTTSHQGPLRVTFQLEFLYASIPAVNQTITRICHQMTYQNLTTRLDLLEHVDEAFRIIITLPLQQNHRQSLTVPDLKFGLNRWTKSVDIAIRVTKGS